MFYVSLVLLNASTALNATIMATYCLNNCSTALVSFQEKDVLTLNLLMVIPSAIIGIIGGFLGVTFILLNLKMAKFRRRILGKIQSTGLLRTIKVLEPVCLAVSNHAKE